MPDPDVPPGNAGHSTAKSPAAQRGTALIVDDEPTNCRLLSQMLRREGFATLEAHDGEQALALFASASVDIVFMDVMMPRMDGFEATRRLKQMTGTDFVPVIFLTALRDEHSLIQCTEAGGDDFLTKPFSLGILKARIQAMERVRDLQRTIASKNHKLSLLLEQDREEQKLAERVFSRAVYTSNILLPDMILVQRPAEMFSGDIVLTQQMPDSGIRVLLGDFTGHGLAAAVGALPVSQVFHAMTRKGADDDKLLYEINRHLYRMLPADRFMAAILITLNGKGDELRWWNGGMPSAWLRQRGSLIELESHALALGILPELPEYQPPRRIALTRDDRLLMTSDGLPEATDSAGRMFADHGFAETLRNWRHGESIVAKLMAELERHAAGVEQADDIAVVELPMEPRAFPSRHPLGGPAPDAAWCWELKLEGGLLGDLPSLEDALQPFCLLNGLDEHFGAMQTILAELYTNALEHGVLQMDSSIKSSPDGFDAYYRERARRLAEDCQGWIRLQLKFEPGDGGRLRILVHDSGPGFNQERAKPSAAPAVQPWGRGIALVRDLCESLTFRENGALVEAVYRFASTSSPPCSC